MKRSTSARYLSATGPTRVAALTGRSPPLVTRSRSATYGVGVPLSKVAYISRTLRSAHKAPSG
eukprot:1204194-Heterocapsa_arctica.AAC.1